MELTERHVTQHLLDGDHPRPLRASKYLLAMIDRMQSGKWTSTEGKSVFQLITDWLELINEYAEEVGMDVEAEQEWKKNQQKETEQSATSEATEKPADGPLIRFEGAPVPIEQFKAASKTSGQSDTFLFPREFTSPSWPTLLPVSHIVHMFLKLFSDQAGHLYTSLATYYIKLGDFATATSTFEHALETVVSIKDFTVVFDAYVEFEETVVSSLMAALDSGADEDDDEDDGPGLEAELDERMAHFEQLITRRPFLLNDVLLRRNPNEVVEWEKRVALYTTQDEEKAEIDAKIIDTYTRAMDAVNPKKAIGPLNTLIVNFAKFYETGGTTQDASPDLDSAREIFEKAVRIPFKTVDELAEVWIEYAELELRHENYSAALKLLQRATDTQGRSDRDVKKINFYDANVPVQTRLLKSLKLWSFYVDLEESIGSVASTTAIYDRILALKIASAQTIVNYAQFLSSQAYHEESFKIYERGIDLFSFPVAYELWNLYLSAFITRYKGSKLERARDLFEQALESCPEKYCKDIFLMYAQLEEEYGLGRRAMAIYERAVSKVQSEDRMEVSSCRVICIVSSERLTPLICCVRCLQSILPKPQLITDCPLLDPSTNKPSQPFRMLKQSTCASDLLLSNVNSVRLTVPVPFMHMHRSFVTREVVKPSGPSGMLSRVCAFARFMCCCRGLLTLFPLQSTTVRKIPLGRCFASSDPSKRHSTPSESYCPSRDDSIV